MPSRASTCRASAERCSVGRRCHPKRRRTKGPGERPGPFRDPVRRCQERFTVTAARRRWRRGGCHRSFRRAAGRRPWPASAHCPLAQERTTRSASVVIELETPSCEHDPESVHLNLRVRHPGLWAPERAVRPHEHLCGHHRDVLLVDVEPGREIGDGNRCERSQPGVDDTRRRRWRRWLGGRRFGGLVRGAFAHRGSLTRGNGRLWLDRAGGGRRRRRNRCRRRTRSSRPAGGCRIAAAPGHEQHEPDHSDHNTTVSMHTSKPTPGLGLWRSLSTP